MSVSHRLYWNLVDMGLESEFCRWLRDTYPILFKELTKQFDEGKPHLARS